MAPPEKQPTSTGFKLLIGCAGLMGVGALVFGLVVAVSLWWIWNPGPQVDPLSITTPDTVALIHVKDLGEDGGFRRYLDETAIYFTDASQGVRSEQLPEEMRWITAYQQSNTNAGEAWTRLLPRDAAFTIDPTLGGATGAAVNFPIMVRPFRTLMSMDPDGLRASRGELTEYRDREVLQLEVDSMLAFEEGTALWADSPDHLQRLIDLQADGGETSPLAADVVELHEEWPLVGVTRTPTVLAELTGRVDMLETSLLAVDRLWFGLRMNDADTLAFRLSAEGGGGEEVLALRELALSEGACPSLESSMREAGLDPVCTVLDDEQGVSLHLTATGLRAATRAAIDEAFTPQP